MPIPLTPQEVFASNTGQLYGLHYFLVPDYWGNIALPYFPPSVILKFNALIRDNMPPNIKTGKGIYMFFLHPQHPFSPDLKHLLYVGRVQAGVSGHNFFKRFYKYVNSIGNSKERPNIQKLTNLWPDHTYVYFYCLNNETDDRIAEIEQMLYNSLLPPLNNKVQD